MKRLFSFLLLVSCNTHDPSRLVGKDGTELNVGKSINVASKSFTNVGFDKYGHPRMVIRDDSEAVPKRALETVETVAIPMVYAGVQKAADAADAAVAVSAQKQVTKQAAINAGLEAERIKAGTEALKITTPPLLPK